MALNELLERFPNCFAVAAAELVVAAHRRAPDHCCVLLQSATPRGAAAFVNVLQSIEITDKDVTYSLASLWDGCFKSPAMCCLQQTKLYCYVFVHSSHKYKALAEKLVAVTMAEPETVVSLMLVWEALRWSCSPWKFVRKRYKMYSCSTI